MLKELKPDEFEKVRTFLQVFDYSLSINAAIEGNNPGQIFVDNLYQPRIAFALTVEGYFLTGDHNNNETITSLKHFLTDKIFTGDVYVNGDWSMSLAVNPKTWETRLPELIPTHEVEKLERYHYLCHKLNFDWHKNTPHGYTVNRVTRTLLNDGETVFSDTMRDWMDIQEMWWTEEDFLSKGISFVVLFKDEVVAWCTPDCVAGDRIDVGVITHPEHRRRGLASIAVAATVEHCLRSGFNAVGWHCNADNTGSWKTAEKVGFKRNREYAYYYYVYDPIDHLAELGWYYYRHGDYAKSVRYYDQVFNLREENPDYYYHLVASAWARLQNKEKALSYLQIAARHGWSHAEWTNQQQEFRILHDTPEWKEILRLMEANPGI